MSTTNAEVEGRPPASEWREERQTIQRTAPDGFWIVDVQGRLLEVNQAYCDLVGYQRDELLGMSIHDVEAVEGQADVERHIQRIIAAGSGCFETRHRCKGGRIVDLEVSVHYLPAKGNLFGFLRDITERKRAEDGIAWLASFPERNPNPVVEIELPSGVVSYANPAARDLFLDLEQKGLAHCWLAGLEQVADELIQSNASQAIRDVTLGDRCYTQTVHCLPGQRWLRVYGTEITGHKRLENVLRRSETKFRALFDSAGDAMMLSNEEGFIDCNKAALAMFGCATREEFCSHHPANMSPLQQPCGTDSFTLANQHIATALEKGSDQFEWRHKRLDTGQTFLADVLLNVVELDGKPVLLGVVRDITARKRAEEALRESEIKYRTLVEHIPQRIFHKDRESVYVSCNDLCARELGISAANVAGKTDFDFYPRELAEKYRADDQRVMELGQTVQIEEDYVSHGKPSVILTSKAPVFDEQGAVIGVLGIFTDITERNRAEDRLRVLSRAVEQCPVSIMITDLDGNIEYANPRTTELTGYTFEELKGKNPRILKSGETPPEEYRRLWGTIQDGEWCGVFHNRKKNGDLFWESATIGPVRDTLGKVTHYLAVEEDTTAQRAADAALAAEAVRRRILFEQSKDGVVVMDRDGKVYEANPSFARMLGYSMEEMRHLHVWDWDAQLAKDQIQELMQAVQRTPATFETRFKRKDGTLLDAEVSSSAAELDGEVLFYAVSRDISERNAAEAALRESEERFRLITETLSEVFWVADANLARIFYVSPAYERVWGRSRHSLYEDPRSFIQAIHPDDRDGALAQFEIAKSGQNSNHEYRVLRPDGSVRWIWDRGFPIRTGSEAVSRYVGIAVDITERKELERQLTQAQKLESIGQLAAGIAHEINTPIQYIGDNGKFLEEAFQDLLRVIQPQQAPAGAAPGLANSASSGVQEVDVEYLREEIPKAIGQLLEGVGQVARIVRAMKEFSHPGPVEKTPLDINRAIASTILVSKNEWKYVADVTTDFDPELPPVPCLAGEFNQVMLNLIVNSAQAIGGVVKQSGKKGAIGISTRRHDNWAEIRVSDTGGGIPEAIRSRVFDPFFTTKEVGKGTGQGLAIAHAVVVQKHQGTITFASETGAGTTFVIRLPLTTSREDCETDSLCA